MRSKVFSLSLIISFISLSLKAQTFPKGYFRNPIDTPFILAGSFGEIRTDHFHTGLDFSTKEKEGLPVYAVAGGYVSRIKVSADGFGKAIYITHPNGFVSVYAHLKQYNGKIEKYVRENQYKLESFEVELFPETNEMKVKKGEVIAFSGNTGKSGGPHLHFEIRDEKSEEPLNPMLFGYSIPDKIKPEIKSLRVVPAPLEGVVMTTDSAMSFKVSRTNDGAIFRVPELIQVFGKIGFEFDVSDYQVKGGSDLGIYSMQFKLDDKIVFGYKYDRLNFNDARYANAHIDYGVKYDGMGTYERCFRLAGNKSKIYDDPARDGYIDFIDEGAHQAELVVKDFNGNISTLNFTILSYSSLMQSTFQPQPENDYSLPTDKGFAIHKSDIDVAIPANALYEASFFSQKSSPSVKGNYSRVYTVGDPRVPLHLAMTLGIKPESLPASLRSKAVIVSYDKKGNIRYEGGSWNNEFLSAKTKHFGTFAISADTINPVITVESEPAKNKALLKIKITDDLSGIKSYRAIIDGKWNLMEYDKKSNMLTGDLDVLESGKTHYLELNVSDALGNTSVLKKDFFY